MPDLTADDLLAPKGELEVDWFAPLDLDAVSARLNEALAAGYGNAATGWTAQQRSDLAQAWGYYNAYKHISSALARKPSVLTINEGADVTTRTYTAQEIQHFVDLRDSWYDVYLALLPPLDTLPERTPSMSVRARFAF